MINVNKIFDELFPICRSITGQGYRSSFNIIKKFIPCKKHKYPTGKVQFLIGLYQMNGILEKLIFKNSAGKKIIDFNQNNLHLMSTQYLLIKEFHYRN